MKITGGERTELELGGAANVHAPLVIDFVEAVHRRRAPAVPLEEAARVNTLLDAIYCSAETRREVTV